MRPALAALAALPLAAPAAADVPRVAADIAPIHSLAAMVMGDLGEPALIVRPGASPHGYAMRPSEAGALQEADLVVWVGGGGGGGGRSWNPGWKRRWKRWPPMPRN
jgi:zinc transport system substrate-binding protein